MSEEDGAVSSIQFKRVTMRYRPDLEALSDLSLEIREREMVFVTGPSGAGKSTLLRLLAALERPTRGQLWVWGRNVGMLAPRRIPAYRRGIGLVFQDHRLLLDRTVFDNVALPLIIAGAPRHEVTQRVRAALQTVGLLSREQERPVVLSGGEQQRIGIARAIVARPPLLIADEPTGNLDPLLAIEIMRLFQRLNEMGTTVIIASHAMGLIQKMDHRILTLHQGTLAGDTGASP
jgi:cell division transport system ATP-binding protein